MTRSRGIQLMGLLVVSVAVGCSSSGVTEDRSIRYSADGSILGFQHGDHGIYVAGRGGRGLQQIYQPDADVVATSTPHWSPDNQHVIFAVARQLPAESDEGAPGEGEDSDSAAGEAGDSAKGDSPQAGSTDSPQAGSTDSPQAGSTDSPQGDSDREWDQNPEGRVFSEQAVVYDCLMKRADDDSEPELLFRAECGHVGYVAGDLAIRWHWNGRAVLFVAFGEREGQHQLFLFDLDSRQRRSVDVPPAEHLAFGLLPERQQLFCVLAGRDASGTWVGSLDDPQNGWLAPGTAPRSDADLLNGVRLSLPVVSKETELLAQFTAAEEADGVRLNVLDPETRQVKVLVDEIPSPRDLHWHPDASRLGFLDGDNQLQVVDLEGQLQRVTPPEGESVRQFAGWNASGDQMAYVVPQAVRWQPQPNWVFLFQPNVGARDEVFVAAADGGAPQRRHAGMRITFPHWSPDENELTLWATFSPSYRSIVSVFLNTPLLPFGDPAAVLDAERGTISWMAVNRREMRQVGHYELLRRNFSSAWEWYERAREQSAAIEPLRMADLRAGRVDGDRLSQLFLESYCLSQLGRDDESADRWRQLNAAMQITTEEEDYSALLEVEESPTALQKRQMDAAIRVFEPLLREALVTEAYLGMNALESGIRRQQARLRGGKPWEQVCVATSLSQMLLLDGQLERYAELVVDRILPRCADAFAPAESSLTDALNMWDSPGNLQRLWTGLALMPLFTPDFHEHLSASARHRLRTRCDRLRWQRKHADLRVVVDLILLANQRAEGNQWQVTRLRRRLARNPHFERLFPDREPDSVGDGVRELLALAAPNTSG